MPTKPINPGFLEFPFEKLSDAALWALVTDDFHMSSVSEAT